MMMAYVSGDAIVVDGATVATLVHQRSNEREALIDALRDGVALEDRETIDDLRREVEDADDNANKAFGERDALVNGVHDALGRIQGDDVAGAVKILRELI